MRAGWRFALVEFGAQCVMTAGITGMQQWCVDNWDTQGVSFLSRTYSLIGASLSEPHTSEFNGGIFIYYYYYISVVRRRLQSSTQQLSLYT